MHYTAQARPGYWFSADKNPRKKVVERNNSAPNELGRSGIALTNLLAVRRSVSVAGCRWACVVAPGSPACGGRLDYQTFDRGISQHLARVGVFELATQ